MFLSRRRRHLFIVVLLLLGCWAGASGPARAQAWRTELTTDTYRVLPDSVLGWASPHGKLDWAVPQVGMRVSVSPDRRFVVLEIPTDLYATYFKTGGRVVGARRALFLRSADPNSRYSLCLGYGRSFDVDWSTDSKFLAVRRENQSRNGSLDMYRVEGGQDSSVTLNLIFRREGSILPDGTSTSWGFGGWRPAEAEEEKWAGGEYDRTTVEVLLASAPIGKISLAEEPVSDSVPAFTVVPNELRDEPPTFAEEGSAMCLVLPDDDHGWASPHGKLNWTVTDGSIDVWVSPNRKFVAVSTRMDFSDTSFEVGYLKFLPMRVLLLRSTDPESRYSLCFGFYKWFNVHWSPDSKYLSITNGYGTHNGDTNVYRVEDHQGTPVTLDLIIQREALFLPEEEFLTRWEFKRWDLKNNAVVIEKYDQNHPWAFESTTTAVSLLSKPIKRVTLTEESVDDRPRSEPKETGK